MHHCRSLNRLPGLVIPSAFPPGKVSTGLYTVAFLSSGLGVVVVYLITVEMYPTSLRNTLFGFTGSVGRVAAIATPFLMRQVHFMSDGHDDVIKWKYFPRYWPFLRGIHRSPVNSPHKGQR